jgi:RND family efflux transporter MFP subunit
MKSSMILIGAITIALAACTGASGKENTMEETAVPVRLAEVEETDYAEPVEATGTLTTRDELQLSFKVGGVVARVTAQEGAAVRKGEILATLDLREINAQLAKAKTALTKAERDLARVRNLHRDSVATLEQLQDATSALDMARSDYNGVAFNQSYATIVAPSNGVVLKKLAEPGELVSVGEAVVVFGSVSSGSVVRAGVADRDAVRLRIGDPATITFSAYPDRAFTGSVSEIPAAANPMTGTYAVEVKVNNPPDMASGLVGRVNVRPSLRGRVRLIPIEAITEADGGHGFVYVVDGTTARRVQVAVSSIDGSRVAIGAGLDDVTHVVSAGGAYLSEGTKVKVIP